MEEFYKNLKAKKSLLVMGIILFVLFMGIGLLLYFDEANAEFVKLSNKTSEGVYAKLMLVYLIVLLQLKLSIIKNVIII